MLPIVPLDGRTNIPFSLPLGIHCRTHGSSARIRREDFAFEEPSHLPLQPTDLDERVTVPQGASPPEIIASLGEHSSCRDREPDIFMTGEVNLLTKERTDERAKSDLARNISS